ncbi:MAG: serine/threonine protein kinase, partial [Deltaproteobacteria bacterium]
MATPARPNGHPSADYPRTFGSYVLLAKLATGGMGEVFLARHRDVAGGFHKLVVLKRLLPHLMEDPRFVAMFRDEARIAARIHHSNVCQTYELGQAEGTYYIAMEYLEGVPLGRVVQERRRDRRLADLRFLGRLLTQVCEGLHAAHELRDADGALVGVVHRDVCHANIFVTSTGIAKVLDFGVAKARGALDKTRTGAVKGTYAYSSPEQLRGEPVDRRSDVFSLGVVAWETFTGRRLFKRDTDYLTFRAITEEPVPSPLDVRPDLPPELAVAIERALSRSPAGRQATAREFGADVDRALRALGPPMSAVAAAALMEDAFADELARQRRLAGVDFDAAAHHGESQDSTRVQDAPALRMPLRADPTADVPAIADDDRATSEVPAFTYTPADTGMPYTGSGWPTGGDDGVATAGAVAARSESRGGAAAEGGARHPAADDGAERPAGGSSDRRGETAGAVAAPRAADVARGGGARHSAGAALVAGGMAALAAIGWLLVHGDGGAARESRTASGSGDGVAAAAAARAGRTAEPGRGASGARAAAVGGG